VSLSSADPLIGSKLFQSHGTAGMKFVSRNTNLCPQTKLVAIAKAGRHINKATR